MQSDGTAPKPDETVDLDRRPGPAQDLQPARLGPWVIDGLRRRSETSNTYLAHAEDTGVRARLAVLHPALAKDPVEVERFRRLSEVRQSLNHPHLVTGVSYGEVDGSHYVVMEHPEGQRLSDLLRASGPLCQVPALAVARQIAQGVAHIHAMGTIHGRVKAGNVVVLEGGHVKLGGLGTLDLGAVARQLAPVEAPAEAVSSMQDIHGIGFLLLQMITGSPRPLTGDQAAYLEAHRIRFPRGTPSRTLQTDTILWRCLAQQPHARYPSLVELLDGLDKALQALLPEAELETFTAASSVSLTFVSDSGSSA